MSTIDNAKSLNAAMLSGNRDYWQEFFSADIVRRIAGMSDLVGVEACQQQEQEFVDGLTAPNRFELKSLAADEENEVSFAEYYNEFNHQQFGHICQTQVHVQRWRDGKVYEESIYFIQHAIETVSG